MKRTAISLLVSIALLLPGPQPISGQDAAGKIDEYMTRWSEAGRFNGAVLVARGDKLIYEKAFGYANLEWDILNAVDTKFDIGSVSKQFTTALVFLLAAEGKIELNAKLTDYLLDYRADTGGRVTIDHLLRHTSGIPCFFRDYKPAPGEPLRFPVGRAFRTDDLIANHMSGDLLFEPGSEYRYSNSGYCLLAKVIENATGRSFESSLREYILEPLGLNDTGLISHERIVKNMAEGYVDSPMGLMRAKYDYVPNLWGAGGMYSTVRDLWKWNLAVFAGDLLPREYREKMMTAYIDGGFLRHAYSLDYYRIGNPGSDEFVEFTSFNGATFGFKSDVFRFPVTDHIVVIIDNSERYNHWMIGPGIYSLLMGETTAMPKRLASAVVAEAEFSEGRRAAMQLFNEIKQNQTGEYEVTRIEDELNTLGFNLLMVNRFDDAIRILQLSADLHPGSTNAFNNLARAYEQIGDSELAEANRARAEELSQSEDKLLELIETGDYALAESQIAKLREKNSDAPLFTPARIGPMYDRIFSEGRIEDALEVCRLWALGNPSTPGPYFSMARIHLQTGDTAKAIECYRKVLEVVPEGPAADAARRAIEGLEQGKN